MSEPPKMYAITEEDLKTLRLAEAYPRIAGTHIAKRIGAIIASAREIPETLLPLIQDKPTPLLPLDTTSEVKR